MSVKWLESQPKIKRGINWGTPWEKGKMSVADFAQSQFSLGHDLQSKILAYWPDGSIKWTGHSGVFGPEDSKLTFTKKKSKASENLAVKKFNGIYVTNGDSQAFFPNHGEGKNCLDWLKVAGDLKITDLRLIALYQGQECASRVENVELEENGPLKAVVKVTGGIYCDQCLMQEFILRFRFYVDVKRVEIIHTLIVISDQAIEGLALSYQTPIVGEPWNRFVTFIGESGAYTEPAQLLLSRRHAVNNLQYAKQVKGEVTEMTAKDQAMLAHAKENAIWNNFKVSQPDHRYYELSKQTTVDYVQLKIGDGTRAMGSVYAGGRNGGTVVSMEKFWQKAPSEIEILGLDERTTKVNAWLWSKDAKAMDFSHYDGRDHMLSAYEGMEEIRSTAVGVANTTRLWIDYTTAPMKQDEILAIAQENVTPAQLVMEPRDYHETQVFGIFSLPDRSTEKKAQIEAMIDSVQDFYLQEVDTRGWYGYWNYGDFMHTYDPYRHVWRYDMGGYAWQNTELVPNIWLWLSFLRSGDPKIYHLVEAMTRHTSEVDQYHAGVYKGLGSRHNVIHWGCQAKEVRISMAGLHRYYYYLTADERVGDIMEQVKDNEEFAFNELPPMREFMDPVDGKIPIRTGPDWSSCVSNWFTQWERTGDKTYLNKILTGLDCIKKSLNGLLSGPLWLFDPKTKKLDYQGTGTAGSYHMVISFGAPQVWTELANVLEDDRFKEMLAEYGWFYALPNDEKIRLSEGQLNDRHFSWPMFATFLMAYGAVWRKDETLAHKAWEQLLETPPDIPFPDTTTAHTVTIDKKVQELTWVTTNCVSQWCLNTICCLELIGDKLE